MSRLLLILVGSDDLQTGAAGDVAAGLFRRAEANVRIIPAVASTADYLRLADAFVFPSRREGMPNVLLEAIATGLPCIVSDIAPHLELASTNPGARILFFKSNDAADLAKVLRKHMVTPECLDRHPFLSDRYLIETVAARYAELYHDVVSASTS